MNYISTLMDYQIMDIMNRITFSLMAVTVLCGSIAMARNESDKATTGLEAVVLDEKAVSRLTIEALGGSGLAARKLSVHYALSKPKDSAVLYWAVIGAENGDVVSQYNASQFMMEDAEPNIRLRGLFWLKKAADAGDQDAIEVLKEISKKLRLTAEKLVIKNRVV